MSQIWGFQTLTETVFIQFLKTLLVFLLGEGAEIFPFFGPVAKFLPTPLLSGNQINKPLIWKADVSYW